MDEPTGSRPAQPPRDDEPGGESTPRDTEGAGPVGLQDRTRVGEQDSGRTGSPAANQARAEPVPPTPAHDEPLAVLPPPPPEEMTVGAGDPQAPRHPAAAGSGPALDADLAAPPVGLGGSGSAPAAQRPVPDAGVSTGRGSGPLRPVADQAGGSAHRVPGLQGAPGPDEAVDTEVVAGAARMGPGPSPADTADGAGDAHGVPVTGSHAQRGTSEEHAVVRGARTADPGD